MSCNRENVTWKGRDGKWNIGFFDFYETGDPFDDDYDYEWDVEYDTSRFNWVSTGHASPDEAYAAWQGSNPGGTSIYDEPNKWTDQYDKMAADYKAANPPQRETRYFHTWK